MPAGFQSFTSSGILQIDAEKKCYVLKNSGTGVSDSTRVFTLRVPLGIRPLVFFHESDGAIYSVYKGPTFRTFIFYSNTANQNVRWYYYDVITEALGTGGFQLFNSIGEITFDAEQRPLALYSTLGNVKPGTSAAVAINIAKEYAVCLPTVPLKSEYVSSTYSNYFIVRPQRSGSNLVFSDWNYLGMSSWGAVIYDMASVTALILDVTGIPVPTYVPPVPPAGYWQITEGYSGGTSWGFASYGTPTFGSITGTTAFAGADIKLVSMSRSVIKGTPFVTFNIGMSGNRAKSFWTNLSVIGYGTTITSVSSTHSYDAGADVTTWWWSTHDIASIDGSGETQGIFT